MSGGLDVIDAATMQDALGERVALALYNEYRKRSRMPPVDHIGANKTQACETCRADARAIITLLAEEFAKVADNYRLRDPGAESDRVDTAEEIAAAILLRALSNREKG